MKQPAFCNENAIQDEYYTAYLSVSVLFLDFLVLERIRRLLPLHIEQDLQETKSCARYHHGGFKAIASKLLIRFATELANNR